MGSGSGGGELLDEVFLGKDGDVEFTSLEVLARCGVEVVVDEEIGGARHAAHDLAPLRFYVLLQLLAVFVMMDITCDDEGEVLAKAACGLQRWFFYIYLI